MRQLMHRQQQLGSLSVAGGRWHGGELVHPDEGYARVGTPGGRLAAAPRTGGRHTVLRKPNVTRGLM